MKRYVQYCIILFVLAFSIRIVPHALYLDNFGIEETLILETTSEYINVLKTDVLSNTTYLISTITSGHATPGIPLILTIFYFLFNWPIEPIAFLISPISGAFLVVVFFLLLRKIYKDKDFQAFTFSLLFVFSDTLIYRAAIFNSTEVTAFVTCLIGLYYYLDRHYTRTILLTACSIFVHTLPAMIFLGYYFLLAVTSFLTTKKLTKMHYLAGGGILLIPVILIISSWYYVLAEPGRAKFSFNEIFRHFSIFNLLTLFTTPLNVAFSFLGSLALCISAFILFTYYKKHVPLFVTIGIFSSGILMLTFQLLYTLHLSIYRIFSFFIVFLGLLAYSQIYQHKKEVIVMFVILISIFCAFSYSYGATSVIFLQVGATKLERSTIQLLVQQNLTIVPIEMDTTLIRLLAYETIRVGMKYNAPEDARLYDVYVNGKIFNDSRYVIFSKRMSERAFFSIDAGATAAQQNMFFKVSEENFISDNTSWFLWYEAKLDNDWVRIYKRGLNT